MKKLIISILVFLIPFGAILIVYLALDPFMVIRKYDKFYDTKAKGWVSLNRDYVSTTNFDWNYKKAQYNSFIFGNSRSIFYQISDWKKYLKPRSNCYHFDASGESLYALDKKINYISNKNVRIKNALLILDYETLTKDKPKTGHLFIISPQLENDKNFFSFQLEFFKSFLSPHFFIAYLDFKLSGNIKPYMKTGFLIDDRPTEYDIITNEIRFEMFETLISEGKYYTEERKKIFYQRDTIQKYSPAAIAEKQKIILKDIFNIFSKYGTNYRIIINPLYQQIKLNKQDLDYLNQLFGRKYVFDFSGINKFTSDYNNYYEIAHYRPHVAREIMKLIYEGENNR